MHLHLIIKLFNCNNVGYPVGLQRNMHLHFFSNVKWAGVAGKALRAEEGNMINLG
jgi:hypothetical protein